MELFGAKDTQKRLCKTSILFASARSGQSLAMTRKKVKLSYIANDSARKATFKKRKKGLMKKVSELSTLCGIDACAIIYSPYESQPEVWPNQLGVQRVLAQFKRMPEMEQSKKMVNQEGFLKQRIAKANEQLKKQQKENREKEMTKVMFQCLTGKGLQTMSMVDLNDLGWLIDQNMKEIYKRSESLQKVALPQVVMEPAPPTYDMKQNGVSTGQVETQAAFDDVTLDTMQRHQWLMELLNPNDTVGFGGDDVMLPFADNQNSLWSNSFFP